MVTQLELAKRQGAIDVSRSPGQRPPSGFATIVRPSKTASQADIRKGIRTGRFDFRFFDIQPTRVRALGQFNIQAERLKSLAKQKLVPATIRGLERGGQITTQEATQLRRIQQKPRARRDTRVTAIRTIRGPFVLRRAPASLKEFGPVFSPRQLSSQELNTLSGKIEREGRILDQRLKNQTASEAEVNRFNNIVSAFNKRVGRAEAAEFRKFFKERPTPKRPPKVIAKELIIGPELTLGDVIPSELGGKTSFIKSVQRGAKETGDFLVSISKTKAVPKNLQSLERKRLSQIRGIGQIIGAIGGAIEPVFTGVTFFSQEAIKTAQSLTGLPDKKTFKVILPKGTAALLRQAKSSNLPVLSEPLQFIRVGNEQVIISRRALAEVPAAALTVALLFLPSGKGRLVRTTKVGSPIKTVATVKVTPTKLNLLKTFKNVKFTSIQKLTNKIKTVPEIKAIRIRVGAEIGKPLRTVKEATVAIKRITKEKKKQVFQSIATKVKPVVTSIERVKVAAEIKRLDVQRVVDNLTVLKRTFVSEKNARTLGINPRNLNTIFKSEIALVDINITRLQRLIRNRQFKSFSPFAEAQRAVIKIQNRVGTTLGVTTKFIKRTTRPVRRLVRKTRIQVRKKITKPIRLEIARLKGKIDDIIIITKTLFRKLNKDLKVLIRPSFIRVQSALVRARNLLIRLSKKPGEVTSLQLNKIEVIVNAQKQRLIIVIRKARKALKENFPIKATKKFAKTISDKFLSLEFQLKSLFNVLSLSVRKIVRPRHLRQLARTSRVRNNFIRKIIGKSISRNQATKLLAQLNSDLKRLEQLKLKARRARIRASNARNQRKFKKEKLANKEEQAIFFDALVNLEKFEKRARQVKPRTFKEPTPGIGEKIIRSKTGQLQIVKTKVKVKLRAKAKPRAVVILRPRQKIRLSSKIRQRAIVAARARQIFKVRVKVTTRSTTAAKLRQTERLAISPKSVVIFATRFLPRTQFRVAQRVALRPRARLITRVRVRPRVKAKLRPIIIPIPAPQLVSIQTIASLKGPFNIVARRRGKIVKLNRFPLTGSQALALGGFKVDNAAIRSFAIVKTTGKTRTIKVPRFNAKKFRRPVGNTKLQKFFLVEKTKFAIDTRGEKREITRKGLKALRLRRKRRKRIVKRKRRVIKRRKRKVVRRKRRIRRRRK